MSPLRYAANDHEYRLGCATCGKSVSTAVPHDTVVRAYIECPECIEQRSKEASEPRLETVERYLKDARFHYLVHSIINTIKIGMASADDIRDALLTAEHVLRTGSTDMPKKV